MDSRNVQPLKLSVSLEECVTSSPKLLSSWRFYQLKHFFTSWICDQLEHVYYLLDVFPAQACSTCRIFYELTQPSPALTSLLTSCMSYQLEDLITSWSCTSLSVFYRLMLYQIEQVLTSQICYQLKRRV